MKITSAEFIISNTKISKCPQTGLPEFAFIGRSNVGKSSLINMLTSRKALAMTSSTPGKTMLINHFCINNSWYIVDLPGYGYAKRGKQAMEELKKMITSYVLHRSQLTNLFVLIDSRLEPQKIDLEFINFLGENGVPFSIIFLNTLLESWEELPPYFITSSEKATGREEVLNYIEQIISNINE